MPVHQFVLVVDREPTEEQIDAILEFDDEPGVISRPREGVGGIEFEREGSPLRTPSPRPFAISKRSGCVQSAYRIRIC